jgi:hypothetical protein
MPQTVRNGIEQAVDDDTLKGAENRQVQSVGPLQAGIFALERCETLLGTPIEGAIPFDRDHPLNQAGKQRRKIAGACPDLENPHIGRQARGLEQASDRVGRVTDLPARDRQWNVAIGDALKIRVEEGRSWNRFKRPQHSKVANAALAQAEKEGRSPLVEPCRLRDRSRRVTDRRKIGGQAKARAN